MSLRPVWRRLQPFHTAAWPRPRSAQPHAHHIYTKAAVEGVGRSTSCLGRSSAGLTPSARRLSHQKAVSKESRPLVPEGWEAVIGVECHAQIRGPAKLFSATPLPTMRSQHNTLASPYDAAHPGTMPSLQRTAVDRAIRAALILHCDIAESSRFDRKHYFYPDLTMGYQITQKYAPFAKNGYIDLGHDEGYLSPSDPPVRVEIEQVQLEQDTAKSSHLATGDSSDASDTYIDLNRSGAGLLEIVSGPQLRTPAQAGAYIRKLQELLRRVGASDGNMDEGSLRCDVNVSIRRKGASEFGTRCEVKNINSVRFVERAIASEVARQHDLLTRGEVVAQQTRGYSEETGQTVFLRSKEDAPDYRYMPDPNLPALKITSEKIKQIQDNMPEHPDVQRVRLLKQYGLTNRDVNVLMKVGLEDDEAGVIDGGPASPQVIRTTWRLSSPGEAVEYFEIATRGGRNPKVVVNWILHELLKTLKLARGQAAHRTHANSTSEKADSAVCAPDPVLLGEFVDLVQSGRLTGTAAKQLLPELVAQASERKRSDEAAPISVLDLAASRGLLAMDEGVAESRANGGKGNENSTLDALLDLCREVISDMPQEVAKIKAGKDKVVMRLVGEVMKRSKGRADGKRAKETLLTLIAQ